MAVRSFLTSTYPEWLRSDQIWTSHRNLFAENGDALARIYAGTGALNTSFTRSGKRTLAGLFADAGKSVGRVIQSNFADAGKQAAIDELLVWIVVSIFLLQTDFFFNLQGNLSNQSRVMLHDPIHTKLDQELKKRELEYSSFGSGAIWVGTFNLNGKPPGAESVLPWLFPDPGKKISFTMRLKRHRLYIRSS